MNETKLEQASNDQELSSAVPKKLPKSTFWPITLAFGVVFFCWGFITSIIISGVGLVAIGFSIAGWIGEMNNE